MANRYNTDQTNSNPRASVGLRSVNNIQAIFQARCKQSPNGKAKGLSRKHGQESKHEKTGKTMTTK